MSVKDFVVELAEVRSVSPKPYVIRHTDRKAADLHRGAILKGELLRINDCLMQITDLVYKQSEDGERDNVDDYTGRILVAKPWGSKGHKYYGLSRRRADIFRQCMLHKQPSKRPLLYIYDEETNDWYCNLPDYPTLQAAMFWVKHERISLSEWRVSAAEVCNKGAIGGARRGQHRGNRG